jgi:hypothetical protein
MKIRIFTAVFLTAFLISITFNTYAQNDVKKVDKKEQTIKASSSEKKPVMKKSTSKEKVIKEDKSVEKKDVKTTMKDGKKTKTTKTSKTTKTEEKTPEKK